MACENVKCGSECEVWLRIGLNTWPSWTRLWIRVEFFFVSKLCRGCSYPTFRTNILETSNHTRIRACRLSPRYKSVLLCSGMLHSTCLQESNSVAWLLKMGPVLAPETSICNNQSTMCNIREERRCHTLIFFVLFVELGYLLKSYINS